MTTKTREDSKWNEIIDLLSEIRDGISVTVKNRILGTDGVTKVSNLPEVQKVKVENMTEPISEVTVKNIGDIKIPKPLRRVQIENLPKIQKVEVQNQTKIPVIETNSKDRPIDVVPVKLVDFDQIVSSSSGSGQASPIPSTTLTYTGSNITKVVETDGVKTITTDLVYSGSNLININVSET